MDIKIFDERILAPSKCGSRHLSKVFSVRRISESIEELAYKTTHIIVRNPLEHFKSAIHTEYYNNSNTELDVLVKSSTTEKGIGHWHPSTYKFLYSVLCTNKSINVVELSNLSTFLLSENYLLEYDKSEYNWSTSNDWVDKDKLYQSITNLYPEEMNTIQLKLNNEISYYDKLIHKNVSKTLI